MPQPDSPILIPTPRRLTVTTPGLALTSVEGTSPERLTSLQLAHRLLQSLSSDAVGRTELAGLTVRVLTEPPADAPEHPEAYGLCVTPNGVEIRAADRQGRLHSVHTLAQLLWNHYDDGHLPGYVVADWPDISWRGVHACYHLIAEYMPDLAPNLPALRERIRLMRHYKANALLLEIESLFPYRRHPTIANALAPSRDEWQDVAALCSAEGVEIIPLVQCLGHAYNVLRHPEYAHLREVPGTTQQYCATNPAVADFYMELVDELIEVFPDLRTFHVGGDESRRLGVCPRCRAVLQQRGLGALYGEHVGEICRRLLDRGLRPLVWADIIETAPDAADYLPEGTVLVYWNYDLLEWSRKPAFEALTRSGHEIITAPAARFGTHNHTMYLYSRAMQGIGSLTRESIRRGYDGTVVTDWMKATPHELSVPALAYALSEAWHPSGTQQEFERAFARLYHHLHPERADDLARAYRLLEQPLPFLEDAQTHALDRLDRFDLSGLTVRERLGRYSAQDRAEETKSALQDGVRRGREALSIAEGLCSGGGPHLRELEILRNSASAQVHTARMGLALLEAARVLRYPTPEDDEVRPRLVGELRELAEEWGALREETRRLLTPGTFSQTIEQALDIKFDPEARDLMLRFAVLLERGEHLVRLF